jgi:preprotein translocase subunit SecF
MEIPISEDLFNSTRNSSVGVDNKEETPSKVSLEQEATTVGQKSSDLPILARDEKKQTFVKVPDWEISSNKVAKQQVSKPLVAILVATPIVLLFVGILFSGWANTIFIQVMFFLWVTYVFVLIGLLTNILTKR